jgi:hypothetical protein
LTIPAPDCSREFGSRCEPSLPKERTGTSAPVSSKRLQLPHRVDESRDDIRVHSVFR